MQLGPRRWRWDLYELRGDGPAPFRQKRNHGEAATCEEAEQAARDWAAWYEAIPSNDGVRRTEHRTVEFKLG